MSPQSPEHQEGDEIQLNIYELIWNSGLSSGNGQGKGQCCQTWIGHILFLDLLSVTAEGRRSLWFWLRSNIRSFVWNTEACAIFTICYFWHPLLFSLYSACCATLGYYWYVIHACEWFIFNSLLLDACFFFSKQLLFFLLLLVFASVKTKLK